MSRKTFGIIAAPIFALFIWMPSMFVVRLAFGYPYELARNMSGYGSWGAFVESLIFVPVLFIPASFWIMFLLGLPFANNLAQKRRTELLDFVKAGIFIGLILSLIPLLVTLIGGLSVAQAAVSPWKDFFILAVVLIITSGISATIYWILAVRDSTAI